jgi:hypothetical protein
MLPVGKKSGYIRDVIRGQTPPAAIVTPLISSPFVQDQLNRAPRGFPGSMAISTSPGEPNERLLTDRQLQAWADLCEFERPPLRRFRRLQVCRRTVRSCRPSRREMNSPAPFILASGTTVPPLPPRGARTSRTPPQIWDENRRHPGCIHGLSFVYFSKQNLLQRRTTPYLANTQMAS